MKTNFKLKNWNLILLCSAIILVQCTANGPVAWQDVKSVKQACKAYPDQMRTMLGEFNLDLAGLEKVKEAYEKDDIEVACSRLLEYYKNGNTSSYLRIDLPDISTETTPLADSIVQDIYTFQSVTGRVPRSDDDHLKWDHNGPQDDIEWAWALNRHHPIKFLLQEYYETGNPKYITYMDGFIKDWIVQSWPYPTKKSRTAMWRGLEVSFRVKVWANVFFNFIKTDYISPATQLLILSALSDHAHYARNFHGSNNWLTMEISGLATVASVWPELRKSNEWLEYALSTMTESLKQQIYPDGSQTELTTHYHHVALSNFYLFYNICKQANVPIPSYFTDEIENMWNYLALIMRPDGNALLNNDADLDYNKDRIIEVSKEYDRKDWLYVASNGKEGTMPEKGPSNIFPWAGHFISRSDYGLDAHWSLFDIGPWGSGHQHNDALHISIAAYGKDILVDAGRFAYRGDVADKFRGYAKGSQGHNVILIDGKGQQAGPKLATEALSDSHFKITTEYDYAWNSFEKFMDVEGKSKHTRALLYVRENFWVVVDNVETDRSRKIETLWHWHPKCEVQQSGDGKVSGKHTRGNLQIIPIGNSDWDIDLVKGQEEPEIQGWYSVRYNEYEPNVASIYSTEIESDKVFVWLLMPYKSENIKVKAEIISQNKSGIRLKISDSNKGIWTLNVPYSNSKGVSVKFNKI